MKAASGLHRGLLENSIADRVFFGPDLLREADIRHEAGRTEIAFELTARCEALRASADPDVPGAVATCYGNGYDVPLCHAAVSPLQGAKHWHKP